MDAAILFEPDGYLLSGPRLMGRQAAGNGFLRAAVLAQASQTINAYTPFAASFEAFQVAARETDPAAQTRWIAGDRLDQLAEVGVLYRPDQILGAAARLRLRAGPSAYSLCGVTHTLATSHTLEGIADILTAPVMPWDALVCTSSAALGLVNSTLDHQSDYLRWRTGQGQILPRPLTPVIPLGVHSADFAFTEDARQAARRRLGIGPDEVVALFAGRLSFNGKAHPYPMLRGLQQAAERTGRKVTLIQAGQFFNAGIEALYRSAPPAFCPGVRAIFVSGKDAADYGRSWAAADLFLSLSDSVQETFGITPLEAMAAGLPVVVSDWNGYKDTVRDGVDGFRIRTWAPEPGTGDEVARDYETGAADYDRYLSRASTAVSIDMGALVARLVELVTDPDLRRRLGAAGQARARENFDWASVYRAYQDLWDEQTAIRLAGAAERNAWLAAAPRTGTGHRDPFEAFAHYPSAHVAPDTRVSRAAGATADGYAATIAHPMMTYWAPPPAVVASLLDALEAGSRTVSDLAGVIGVEPARMALAIARLAKLGVVDLAD
ncbi:glycosyltransferase family 4 protein [Phenylobacterium sp.]|uniref:glycosyltransferase family 4 protein n=1 Tax=Phenylobacterium sp. TaxID=1871053 RepID=UPI003982ECE9